MKCFSYDSYLSGSSNLTVAAEWKTIETSVIRVFKSVSDKPRPGRVMSPWTGINLDNNFGFSFLICSKI